MWFQETVWVSGMLSRVHAFTDANFNALINALFHCFPTFQYFSEIAEKYFEAKDFNQG